MLINKSKYSSCRHISLTLMSLYSVDIVYILCTIHLQSRTKIFQFEFFFTLLMSDFIIIMCIIVTITYTVTSAHVFMCCADHFNLTWVCRCFYCLTAIFFTLIKTLCISLNTAIKHSSNISALVFMIFTINCFVLSFN